MMEQRRGQLLAALLGIVIATLLSSDVLAKDVDTPQQTWAKASAFISSCALGATARTAKGTAIRY